jgi:hypothetical protein
MIASLDPSLSGSLDPFRPISIPRSLDPFSHFQVLAPNGFRPPVPQNLDPSLPCSLDPSPPLISQIQE